MRYSVIRERYGVKDDVAPGIEKGMLRWFCHMERIDVRVITTQIYSASMEGNVVKLLTLAYIFQLH